MAFAVTTAPTLSVTKGSGTRTINYSSSTVKNSSIIESSYPCYRAELYNSTTSTVLKSGYVAGSRSHSHSSYRYSSTASISLTSGTQSVTLPDTDTTHTIIIRGGFANYSSETPSRWSILGTYTVTVPKKDVFTVRYYNYSLSLMHTDTVEEAGSYTIYDPGTSLYKFSNWNTKKDDSGTSYEPGDSIASPSGDLDLYAITSAIISGDYEFFEIDSTNHYVRATAIDRTKSMYKPIPRQVVKLDTVYTTTALGTSTASDGCFYNCTNFKGVAYIPDSITDIKNAFRGCTSMLYPPALPDSITDMSYSFYGCTALKQAPAIPQSANMSYAFYGCNNLKAVTSIGSSVTNMSYAFYNCASITSIPYIPSTVTNLTNAFSGCSLLSNTIHVYGSPSTYTNAFSSTVKPIYVIPHSSSSKTTWNTIASSYPNMKVLDEPALDTYHNSTVNKDIVTFGGYDETTTNKVVSYLDFRAEKDIQLEVDSDTVAMLNYRGWNDIIVN